LHHRISTPVSGGGFRIALIAKDWSRSDTIRVDRIWVEGRIAVAGMARPARPRCELHRLLCGEVLIELAFDLSISLLEIGELADKVFVVVVEKCTTLAELQSIEQCKFVVLKHFKCLCVV
jgi:hypothetical protein